MLLVACNISYQSDVTSPSVQTECTEERECSETGTVNFWTTVRMMLWPFQTEFMNAPIFIAKQCRYSEVKGQVNYRMMLQGPFHQCRCGWLHVLQVRNSLPTHWSNLLLQKMKDISFYSSPTPPPPNPHTYTHFLLSRSRFLSACLVCGGLLVWKASFIWSFNTSWPLSPGVCVCVCVCMCASVCVCTGPESTLPWQLRQRPRDSVDRRPHHTGRTHTLTQHTLTHTCIRTSTQINFNTYTPIYPTKKYST